MSVNGLNSGYSGMRVNAFRQDVSANNVANINTEGFQASEVATSDAAYVNDIGSGTRVSATYQPPRPQTTAPGSAVAETGMAELSNTDAAREMTNQLAFRNAYEASADSVRAMDAAAQSVLDLRG